MRSIGEVLPVFWLARKISEKIVTVKCPLALIPAIGYLFGMIGPVKTVGIYVEGQTRAVEFYTRTFSSSRAAHRRAL